MRGARKGGGPPVGGVKPAAGLEVGGIQPVDALAAGLLVLLCATWGLNQVVIKVANAGISPVLQAGLRSIGSAFLVWAWARAQGVPMFRRDGSLGWGVLVGTLFGAEFLLLYLGLDYTSASRGVLFLYMSPFVVAIGAHLFVPGERLTGLRAIGLATAFAGIAIAFADGLRLPSGREITGDLMCFAAAILWGSTTVMIKASPLIRLRPEKMLFYQLAVSGLVLPPASLALRERGIIDLSPLVVGALAYQIVIVAFATYVIWFWLITRYPASNLAAFSFLTPLFGVLAGALLLAEPVTPALILALALVALGIYLVNKPASA